jgi:glutamate--cysteine ligase
LSVPVIPSPRLGWRHRAKSTHFEIVGALAAEFGEKFGIDPWKLTPITTRVDGVSEDHLDELANAVESVLSDVRKKYAEHGVKESPYVFIKNDSGTYGLGIVTVSSAEEISAMNRKKRGKLFSTKAGNQTNRFLVQEGLPTVDTYSGFPLEPVIYGVGRLPVGGFFRLHEGKDPFESLNAPGMSFSCLCLHKLDEPHEEYFLNCKDKQRLVCGAKFVTRFAALAAALEANKLEKS